MANEFKCWDCGGDATRCDCHKNRKPVHYQMESVQERIDRNDAEIKTNLRLFLFLCDQSTSFVSLRTTRGTFLLFDVSADRNHISSYWDMLS